MYNTAYKHISFFHYKLPVHLQNSLLTLIAIVNPAYRSICPFYIILQLKYSSTTAHMCGTRPIHRTEKKKKERERGEAPLPRDTEQNTEMSWLQTLQMLRTLRCLL